MPEMKNGKGDYLGFIPSGGNVDLATVTVKSVK